jgi:hypothetical protein
LKNVSLLKVAAFDPTQAQGGIPGVKLALFAVNACSVNFRKFRNSDTDRVDQLTILRDTLANLTEASTDYIGHYLDNPNFVHDHGEIEPSLEYKGNRPTERESLQPAGSQNDETIRILLRKSPVLSRRKGKIHYAPTIYLQSHEGKTRCSALFRYVASEEETWSRKIDEIVSTPGSGCLEALNSLWVTHSAYTAGLG